MSDDEVSESVLLRRFIAGRQFDLFFDLDEDYEATGFYIYEGQREDRHLGGTLVDAIKSIGPVDGDENTDAGLDLPISEGLYGINPKWKDQGWSAYAYYESADHVATRLACGSSSDRDMPYPRPLCGEASFECS